MTTIKPLRLGSEYSNTTPGLGPNRKYGFDLMMFYCIDKKYRNLQGLVVASVLEYKS